LPQKPKVFHGWIVVALALMAITTYGLFFSYSLFIEPLEAEWQTSRAAISAVYTIYMVVYSACAIPMGWFSDRYGPRKALGLAAFLIGTGISLCSLATSVWQLYIFYGVIASLGQGAIYVVPTSTVNRWFVEKKGLAVGIAISGVGVGLLVVPPVTSHIIINYGWQMAFIALGTTFFAINALVAVFIRGKPEDIGLQPLGKIEQEEPTLDYPASRRDFTVAEAIKTKPFWMIYLIGLFCFSAEQMVLVHIVPYSTGRGISPTEASFGISLLGIGTIVGRIIAGLASDRIGRIPTLAMCCFIEGAAIFGLLGVNSPAALYLTMFIHGLGYGGWAVLCSVMLGEFFGLKNLGMLIGAWFTVGALSGILGPLTGGIIFDTTKSYFLAIIIAGAISMGAVIASALIKPPKGHP